MVALLESPSRRCQLGDRLDLVLPRRRSARARRRRPAGGPRTPDGAIGLRATATHRLALRGRAVLGATLVASPRSRSRTWFDGRLTQQTTTARDRRGKRTSRGSADGRPLSGGRLPGLPAGDGDPVRPRAGRTRERRGTGRTAAHATSVQPENPFAWEALGQYGFERGEFARALHALRRAAALDVTRFTDPDLDDRSPRPQPRRIAAYRTERQARSNGRRQAFGRDQLMDRVRPMTRAHTACTGGGSSSNGIDRSHGSRCRRPWVNSVWSPRSVSRIRRS